MNNSVKKKVNSIKFFSNKGLSPSCITLSFDGFGSISWHIICFFGSFYSFHNFSDLQLFRPEYHWRDLISRDAHLVHWNWYRISFTFEKFWNYQSNHWWNYYPKLFILDINPCSTGSFPGFLKTKWQYFLNQYEAMFPDSGYACDIYLLRI
jgi:hypothetical protein